MKKYKTLGTKLQTNLPSYEKINTLRKCRHIKYIIVFVLLICICNIKNVNRHHLVNTAKTNKGSPESFKMLHQIASVFDKSIITKLKSSSKTEYDEHQNANMGSINLVSKPFDIFRKLRHTGPQEIHKQVHVNKTKILKRLKRYDNMNNSNNATLSNPSTFYAAAIKCQEYQNNCTLYCLQGSVSFLDDNFNDFKPKCPNTDISLMVKKCEFNFGILQQSFFYSTSALALLAINECNLQTIKKTAFQHQNVKNLHTLILINNQLITLEDNTFDGLTKLNRFEFVQNPLSTTTFKGDAFLKPLAGNLKEAAIQPAVNGSEISDPSSWWRDLQMLSVTSLDLSNTNLQGVLNSKTFETFVNLQRLILSNCNLLVIKAEVFRFVDKDFKYLDLQHNHIKSLDFSLLQKLAVPGLEMNLNSNDWFCECEGEMLQYFAVNSVYLRQELVCSSPDKWKDKEFKRVMSECEQEETSTQTLATTSTTIKITKALSTTTPMTTSMQTSGLASTQSISDKSKTTTTKFVTQPGITTGYSTATSKTENNTAAGNSLTTSTSKPENDTTTSNSVTTNTTKPENDTMTDSSTAKSTSKPENDRTTSSSATTNTSKPKSDTTTGSSARTSTSKSDRNSSYTADPTSDMKTIQCAINGDKTDIFWKDILKPKINFTVRFISATSLTLTIKAANILPHFAIVYFTNEYDYNYITDLGKINYIGDLTASTAYVICLIVEPMLTVSPFDCQAHFVAEKEQKSTWLLEKDKAWFISLISIIAILLLLASILLAYKLLRCNPHWLLKRKQNWRQVNSSSGEALISTRHASSGQYSFQSSPVTENSALYLDSQPPLLKNNQNDGQTVVYYSQHVAPLMRAPQVPPSENVCRNSKALTRRAACRNNLQANAGYLDIIENDPDYQTIDYYEVITN